MRFIREQRDVWQATVQLSLMAATLPLMAALIPVYLESVLGQSVGNLPVVMLPAVVGMLLGLRLVSSMASRRDAAAISATGLTIFIAGLVALSLIDALDETVGAALDLRTVDLVVLDLTAKSQIVMVIVLPMGFALSLVNVAGPRHPQRTRSCADAGSRVCGADGSRRSSLDPPSPRRRRTDRNRRCPGRLRTRPDHPDRRLGVGPTGAARNLGGC